MENPQDILRRTQEHKNIRPLISYTLITCTLILVGCAKQQQFKTVEQICVPDMGQAKAMRTGEDVLGKMHFTIEKADAEQGFIRTRPLSGAQFFEFWRTDNVGAFNFAEANLHTTRRTVELQIDQQGEKICIGCDVNVQRLSLPEHQFVGRSRVHEMFAEGSTKMQMLKLHPGQMKDTAWVDLGKDTKLATAILKRIEKQIAKRQKGKTR